jgi:hypothetical protein
MSTHFSPQKSLASILDQTVSQVFDAPNLNLTIQSRIDLDNFLKSPVNQNTVFKERGGSMDLPNLTHASMR